MSQVMLSVVVPVRDEAANILPLIDEIEAALTRLPAGAAHEIVYVDDGSVDDTPRILEAAVDAGRVRRVRHRAGCGQSAAIVSGVRAAKGEWIATLDGDGQNDPADIPALFARALIEPGHVLVAGHRVQRNDSATKRWSSRIANGVRAKLLGDATPDTGCGLKMIRRDLFMALPHFDHMHRFLPALVLRAGGRSIPVPVRHRPRLRGRSKYGTWDRLWIGIVDLAGVLWLQRRAIRPEVDVSADTEAMALTDLASEPAAKGPFPPASKPEQQPQVARA